MYMPTAIACIFSKKKYLTEEGDEEGQDGEG